jgi:hypothetical protein
MGLERKKFAGSMGVMETASDIINAAGRDRLKVKFGVKDRVLQIYAATNMLPAAWFDALENMTGQQLPRHLFTFKGAAE